jgi:hypothetical protein
MENYPTSYVTSLILKNKELTVKELNDLHPTISTKQFGAIRKRLVRQGLVSEVIEKKIDNVYTINDTEVPKDEVKKLIYKDIKLMPKQLNMLYPNISTGTFVGVRHHLPEIRLERHKKNHLKKNIKYIEKNFESKEEIRNLVAKLVAESGVYGLIPVLPHFDWLGEVAIDTLCKRNYYLGIANDIDVFKGASIQIGLLGINGTMVLGDMHTVLRKYQSNSFAHIGMDFCGVLPKEIITLEYAMKNDLVQVGGYMFLTVSRTVRKIVNGYGDEFMTYVNMNTPDTKMTNSEFANDKMIKARFINNDKYALVKEIPYDTDSQMMFYAIKRLK